MANVFRVPYRSLPDGQGSSWYCVLLNVQFSLPGPRPVLTMPLECLIDSGATSCLFHADIARLIGLDLRSGVRQLTNGISGVEETWVHEVVLHLPGGPSRVRAGFKDNLNVAGLLGMRGFFDHYHISFDSALKECLLTRIYQA